MLKNYRPDWHHLQPFSKWLPGWLHTSCLGTGLLMGNLDSYLHILIGKNKASLLWDQAENWWLSLQHCCRDIHQFAAWSNHYSSHNSNWSTFNPLLLRASPGDAECTCTCKCCSHTPCEKHTDLVAVNNSHIPQWNIQHMLPTRLPLPMIFHVYMHTAEV